MYEGFSVCLWFGNDPGVPFIHTPLLSSFHLTNCSMTLFSRSILHHAWFSHGKERTKVIRNELLYEIKPHPPQYYGHAEYITHHIVLKIHIKPAQGTFRKQCIVTCIRSGSICPDTPPPAPPILIVLLSHLKTVPFYFLLSDLF